MVIGLNNGCVKIAKLPPYGSTCTAEGGEALGPMRQMDVEEEPLPSQHTDEVLAM